MFGNAGEEKIFLASADWMSRNLMNRIECAFPLYDETARKTVLDIFELQWADAVKARKITGVSDNELPPNHEQAGKFSSQQLSYNYFLNRMQKTD